VATIYISSTYNDLKEYRDAVARVLQQLDHHVIAMENYVATDQRPLEKCLEDVERAELYIGIFAWRYGYIPPHDNPEQKSITELEYRKAVEAGKSKLIFLLDSKATWHPLAMDAVTGEGDRGARILSLRNELGQEKLVGFFQSSEELAKLVSTAVSKWAADRAGKPFSPDDVNRRRYLEKMSERYGTVKLPIGPPEGFYLHAVFQPLMLRRDPLAAEDLERKRRRPLLGEVALDEENLRRYGMSRAELERMNVMDAASQPIQHVIVDKGEDALEKSPQKRVVILGGPGTGKTTTLKYLAGQRAQRALASPDVELPIFFSLAAYAQSGKTLQRYLVDVVEDMKAEASYAEVLWKEIEAGRAFLCLDSLDEVAPNDRPKVIEQINSWAADKGNTWIVGSRFTEYKGGQFKQGQFAEWELLPMNSALRRELARRLLPELQRLLQAEGEQAPVSAETFVNILEHHSQAAAWGENPLLFSLAAVVYLKIGHLPSSRAALYREVIEAVLKTREHDPVRCKLLERLLTDLALWLHQRRGRTFTLDDLIAFLLDQQRKTWGDTTDLIHRIISSGIIEIVAHDTYAFRHQTFQEYLAAVELARRLTAPDPTQHQAAWDLAWSKRTYSRWTEILRLMVGVLVQTPGSEGPQIALHWLQSLLAQRHQTDADPGNLGLSLVLKSLTEVSEMEEWTSLQTTKFEEEIISTWLQDLIAAAQYERTSRLERLNALAYDIGLLREQAVSSALDFLTHALDDHNQYVRSAVVKALGGFGGRLPLRILFQSLQDGSWMVQHFAREVLEEQGSRLLQEPNLSGALKHPSSDVRRFAVSALGKQGERVPVDILIQTLHDEDHDVRSEALRVLGEQGEQVPVDVFLHALEDENDYVRYVAIHSLGKQQERVPVDVFLHALENEDKSIWEGALESLAEQGERVSIDVFIDALQDKNSYIRKVAIEGLDKQRERVSLNVFLHALEDEYRDVRKVAVEVLGRREEQVSIDVFLRALEDEDYDVRRAAIGVLGKRGEQVPIEVFVHALEDKDDNVRKAVVEALGRHSERMSRVLLLKIAKSGNWMIWSDAAQVLIKQGEKIPLDACSLALKDKDSNMRRAVIEVMSKQGDQIPLDAILHTVDDKDINIWKKVIVVLRRRGEQNPLEVFMQSLEDEDSDVRELALLMLAEQGRRVPIELLLRRLQDENWSVRLAAVEALDKQEETVPLDVFLQALKDEDNDVRKAVVEALDKRGEQVPLDVFLQALKDENSNVRKAVVEVLGKRGEQVPLVVFLRALEDEDSDVWKAGIEALARQEKRFPFSGFLHLLQSTDSFTRQTVVEVLGKREEQVPLDVFLQALEDEDSHVRRAAIEVLGKRREEVPLNIFMQTLQDKSGDVRKIAIEVLSKQRGQIPLDVFTQALVDESASVRGAVIEALSRQGKQIPYNIVLPAIGDDSRVVQNAMINLLPISNPPDMLAEINIEARAILQGQAPGRFFGSITQGFLAETIENVGYISPFFTAQLLPMLDWHYWQVRMKAAQALGKIRRNIPDEAIQRVLELRHDPVRAVREAADDALGEILSLEAGMEDEV